jgi:hypothetical protein
MSRDDPNASLLFRRLLSLQQHQGSKCRHAEHRRYDQHLSTERADEQTEAERSQRLADPVRRSEQTQPVAIVLRPEDRQGQRPARDGQDAVSGSVQKCERRSDASSKDPLCVPKTLNPTIVVMKSAQDGVRTYETGSLNRPRNRRIFVKGSMSPDAVVVASVRFQNSAQMCLAQDNDVVQTLPPDRSDQPFSKAILPR